jgi:acetyl-CoA/propionyl-CoA carboxylase biotin carboxyl carrier protein
MPGSVIAAPVANGASVAVGEPVIVIEAMKMEHALTAPVAGTVEVLVVPGAQVKLDQVLVRVVAHPAETVVAQAATEPAVAETVAAPIEREGTLA